MRPAQTNLALCSAALLCVAAFWKYQLFDPADTIDAGSIDAYSQIYPMWYRAADWLSKGDIPLWNPYQMNGQPFHAAVLYGIYYPPNLLRVLMPAQWAMEAVLTLHLALAWLFTYAYGRTIDLGRAGAVLAAFTYAFCGAVVSRAMWFLPAVSAAIWLPVCLLAVELVLKGRRALGCALLGIGVAMPILAGWLQDWTHSMQAVAIYSILRIAPRLASADTRRGAVSALVVIVAGGALGLALAAVQLLPSFELQRLGPRRPGGLSLEQTLLYGSPMPGGLLARALDPKAGVARAEFVGYLPLLLAPVAFFAGSQRWRVVALTVIAVWGVLVALGTHTPALEIYRMLPAGTWFRVPARILLLYAFAAAALAGLAFDWLLREPDRGRRRIAAVLASMVALLATQSASPEGIVLLALTALLMWTIALPSGASARAAASWPVVAVAVFTLFQATRAHSMRPAHDLEPLDEHADVWEFLAAHQGLDRHYVHFPSIS